MFDEKYKINVCRCIKYLHFRKILQKLEKNPNKNLKNLENKYLKKVENDLLLFYFVLKKILEKFLKKEP